MYNITLQNNTNYYNKKTVFSFPQKKYWLNNLSTTEDNVNTKSGEKYSKGLLILGLGLLFLSNGVQKRAKNVLQSIRDFFEYKIDKSFLDKATPKLSFYEHSVRWLNLCLKKSDSINNIISLKDILFMKLMYKTNPTKKIHKKISDFFEYLSRKTVVKSYKKTQRKFNDAYKIFDKLDDYLLKNSPDELIEYNGKKQSKKDMIALAKEYRTTVKLVVDSFIDPRTLKSRYKYMKNSTSQLYSQFWEQSFKGFWTKDNKFKRKEMWQTFIAAEQIKFNKTDLAKQIAFARNVLSYSDSEKKLYLANYLDNLSSIIPIEDIQGAEIIKRLRWYSKDHFTLSINKSSLLNEIKKLENHNIIQNQDEKIATQQLKDKDINLKLIKEIANETYQGELYNMLEIYHAIAPFDLVRSGALKKSQEAVELFDKSVNLEIGEFFDKLRDLEIGSAPTDVLTILMSTITIIRTLEKSKNNDERSTIILKSGIPIAGAIATTLITATKLVSSGKSLILGAISGFILNRVGVALADLKNKK